MAERSRETEDRAVQDMLEASYCPPLIQEARDRQDAILAERFRGRARAIADVGCGTGYHGSLLAPQATVYHGFEIAPEIARVARQRWEREGLANARLFVGDVAEVELEPDFYDLVLCLYFTPGNFREPADASSYTDAFLDENPGFVAVFSRFREAMKEGALLLLTVYKDVPEAEAAQIDFYAHAGQRVVTPEGSRFVATADGFWSVRFTRESLLSNLRACGFEEGLVTFHDLNAIAWLVEIAK
jgi:SAM-dependent methyltransferase